MKVRFLSAIRSARRFFGSGVFLALSLAVGTIAWASTGGRDGTLDARASTEISADVVQLRSDKGTVFCALYNGADGFPSVDAKAFRRTQAKVSGAKATCRFPGVPAGTYAIAMLHDENDNGKLDTNFIGMPKEGYGASNDAKGFLGPPKFKDAQFDFVGGLLLIKIHVQYL